MGKLTWTDLRGREQIRTTNETINIEDFRGTPGFPWLVIAANRHLSAEVLATWLEGEGENYRRSRSWIAKRRWLFQDPDIVNKVGERPDRDGKDAQAIEILRENRTMSARDLARLLKQNGISRGKDWVLKNRCR